MFLPKSYAKIKKKRQVVFTKNMCVWKQRERKDLMDVVIQDS